MLALVFAVLLGVVAYKTVFVPVSVGMESYPKKIFINTATPVDIKVVALNRIGFRIPFMRLHGKFIIPEGATKIQVLKTEDDEMIFRTKSTAGKLVVLYYTPIIPFPVEIVLDIETSALAYSKPSLLIPS
ncbi:MAG: hypothetical protein M1378_09460 [Bacteroidetes bacterium]|nr:hypothetical protein [Bacteroidota bacterium]